MPGTFVRAGKRGAAPLLAALLLAAATAVVYAPVRDHEFAGLDVETYLTENPAVKDGLSARSVIWAFTTRHASNWHPVTWLSHLADVEFLGLAPGGHLLVSAALHLAASLALLFVLRAMTGALWPAAFVAGVFALHPLHVESVAWVVERKDILSALFGTLALGAYLGHVRRRRWWGLPLTALLLALGLMAKPSLVTLPFVLLLLDWWPLGRFQGGGGREGDRPLLGSRAGALLVEKAPLFALSLASTLATLWAQDKAVYAVPPGARAANALVSYVTYVLKGFLPSGLAAYYPHPWSTGAGSPVGKACLALLLLGAITGGTLRLARKAPFAGVGWLWFLGTLVPMIGIVQVGGQAMADRYTYLPLTGLAIAVAWTGQAAARRRPRLTLPLALLALITLTALAALARAQVSTWRSNEALYEHALAVTERNWMAHDMYGRTLLLRGRTAEATRHFEEALAISPNLPGLRNRLGLAYWRTGRTNDAAAQFGEALRLDPSFAPARYNLGLLAADLRQWGVAREQYRVLKALRLPEADQVLLRIPPAERRP